MKNQEYLNSHGEKTLKKKLEIKTERAQMLKLSDE